MAKASATWGSELSRGGVSVCGGLFLALLLLLLPVLLLIEWTLSLLNPRIELDLWHCSFQFCMQIQVAVRELGFPLEPAVYSVGIGGSQCRLHV